MARLQAADSAASAAHTKAVQSAEQADQKYKKDCKDFNDAAAEVEQAQAEADRANTPTEAESLYESAHQEALKAAEALKTSQDAFAAKAKEVEALTHAATEADVRAKEAAIDLQKKEADLADTRATQTGAATAATAAQEKLETAKAGKAQKDQAAAF
ncbi:hypothetical protein FO498_26920, partial [Bacillus cereus]|nr:hypothetical protein [Bacillus cereus]